MIKKLIALVPVVAVFVILSGFATASEGHKSTPHLSGTITTWDDLAKTATVKDSRGKETSIGWNEKTVVAGTPKVGEHASVSYTKDKDGKIWATHITIGAKPASMKPSASK